MGDGRDRRDACTSIRELKAIVKAPEARVGTERIEPRIGMEQDQVRIPVGVRAFKVRERTVMVPQVRPGHAEYDQRHILACRFFLELGQRPVGLSCPTAASQRQDSYHLQNRARTGKGQALLDQGERLWMLAQLNQAEGLMLVSPRIEGIELQDASAGRHGLLESPCIALDSRNRVEVHDRNRIDRLRAQHLIERLGMSSHR